MQLHSMTINTTQRDEGEYTLLIHATFSFEGRNYSVAKEVIVDGVPENLECAAALDVLSTTAIELLKNELMAGQLMRNTVFLHM